MEYHLQAASRAFWVNKWVLCDKPIRIGLRIEYFDAVVSPMACLGSGHRKVYQCHMMDVEWRRLLHTLCGPPPGLDWSRPWHEILHHWNLRVRQISASFHMQSWSCKCPHLHWNFAHYIGRLPANRWVRCALSCSFPGAD